MEEHITVLVIDEHEAVCAALARRIEEFGGFQVIEATSNPVLAAELAHELNPDLIIADFKRGPRPRPEMARWLLNASPRSKLVIYGSYYTDGEREAFASAGAARCLLKGMSGDDLSKHLRAVASSRNGSSPS
jgi:two-component system vancomycin resistance associated response regulator VraR